MATIGFLGFGEVGSCFAHELKAHGKKVLAYDIMLEQSGGLEKLSRHGPLAEFLPLEEMLPRVEIVLSTVTTDVALDVAQDCAPLLKAGQAYIDLNATTPSVKRNIAAVIEESGADFVEGAILPAVGVMGAQSKVLLCGSKAAETSVKMTALGLNFVNYGAEIGNASSFKMLRSVFSKGLEALLVECMLAGRRAGIEGDLWSEIVSTLDAAPFEDVGGNWVRSHATAHERRLHEMLQVKTVLQDLGIDAPMTDATVKLFERSTKHRLKDKFPEPPENAIEVIDALDTSIATRAQTAGERK